MLQDDESLALALRGGLRGRFQGTFNQLENAVEVLDDYMLQHLNPAEYADLRTMMREINWQLAYLRRLGDHAADAAAAPVLQMLRVPAPLELLSQLHETVELFNELTVGGHPRGPRPVGDRPGLDVSPRWRPRPAGWAAGQPVYQLHSGRAGTGRRGDHPYLHAEPAFVPR